MCVSHKRRLLIYVCIVFYIYFILLFHPSRSIISSVSAVRAAVNNAGRATFPAGMFAILLAFHHLWGRACVCTFVDQPIGTPSL